MEPHPRGSPRPAKGSQLWGELSTELRACQSVLVTPGLTMCPCGTRGGGHTNRNQGQCHQHCGVSHEPHRVRDLPWELGMEPRLIRARRLPRVKVSHVRTPEDPREEREAANTTFWRKHPAHPRFQADSTLLQPTPSPGAYLAGKSQTIREAVPANFLQGTCNFLLGLSCWLLAASQEKARAAAFPQSWLPLVSSGRGSQI